MENTLLSSRYCAYWHDVIIAGSCVRIRQVDYIANTKIIVNFLGNIQQARKKGFGKNLLGT